MNIYTMHEKELIRHASELQDLVDKLMKERDTAIASVCKLEIKVKSLQKAIESACDEYDISCDRYEVERVTTELRTMLKCSENTL